MRYQKWKCAKCGDEFITDKKARWQMVGCKEGCSSVDAEEYYTRFMGSPKLIKESNNKKEL